MPNYHFSFEHSTVFSASKMFKLLWLCFITIFLNFYNVQGMSDEMKELAAMLHNTCQAQSGVADDILARGQNKEFPEDQNLKCYIKCLMTESGVMDENGAIDAEAVIAMLPDEIQSKVAGTIRICADVSGADPCETAFLSNKCFYEHNPDEYMLI